MHTHTTTGAIAITSGLFSDDSQSPTISGVQCTGAETDLLSCTRSISIDSSICDTYNDAGVVCQSRCGKMFIVEYIYTIIL